MARSEIKRYKRRRVVKLGAIGEGAEWKLALSPTAPNELNYALPWLLMGQIQKTSRYFLSKQDQKTISRYCPFKVVVFIENKAG
jgi:hypothetical protein